MQTVYYNFMRTHLALLLCIAIVADLSGQSSSKTSAPMRPSATDSHEGVTIGIDPWTQASRYKEKFPKKSPFSGGIVALRVSFANENDHGVRVNLQRIRLLVQVSEDSRQELVPLSADEVADTVLLKDSGKDPTAKRIPLPIPVGKAKPSRDANWTALRDACQNAAVPTNVVAAHSTIDGLMYFDLRGEVELLQTARLYVPNISTMDDNQPLSYFDIDLGHTASN
jgi:hypothetical protein